MVTTTFRGFSYVSRIFILSLSLSLLSSPSLHTLPSALDSPLSSSCLRYKVSNAIDNGMTRVQVGTVELCHHGVHTLDIPAVVWSDGSTGRTTGPLFGQVCFKLPPPKMTP